jgi:hypothetical protein
VPRHSSEREVIFQRIPFYGVYISHSQLDAFAKAQSHTIDGEEKDLVAQPVGCGKELVYLIDGQDIRNPGCLWRFYQGISSQVLFNTLV